MKAKLSTLLLPFALFLGGCPDAKFFSIDRIFETRIGQTNFSESRQFAITLIKIEEDSRCPIDVQCITAGKIVVKAEVRDDASYHHDTLSFGSESIEESRFQYKDFEVHLLGVKPNQSSERKIAQSDYRFELKVSEKQQHETD